MSDGNPIQFNKQSSLSSDDLNIRTMRGDIEGLKKGGQSKTVEPPGNLPTSDLKERLQRRKMELGGNAEDSIKKESALFPHRKPDFLKERPISPFAPPVPKGPEGISRPAAKPIMPSLEPKPAPIPPAPAPTPTPMDLSTAVPEEGKGIGFYLILLIIVILAGGGGFLYLWNYIREPAVYYKCENFQCVMVEGEGTSQCQINNDCIPPEPAKPDSLIPVETTEIIEIEPYQESIFLSILTRSALGMAEEGSLNRILIKKISEQKEKKYASLAEFASLNKINIPLSLRNYFEEEYTLFVYIPTKEEYNKCQEAGIIDSGCYGPRLGLVIRLSDKEKAAKELEKWETSMVDDLSGLILSSISAGEEESVGFQSDSSPEHQEFNIRYQNLPISPIALNYGFVKDLLVIGTSKYGLYVPLDKLINE